MKNKKRKKIGVKFSNRWTYFLITIVILAVIAIAVYALTAGIAQNPGHLLSDISPYSGCADNTVLKWNGNSLFCDNYLKKGQALYIIDSHCSNAGDLTIQPVCDLGVYGSYNNQFIGYVANY